LLALPALVNLASAAVKFFGGGAKTENIENGAVTSSKLGPNIGGYNFFNEYGIWDGVGSPTLPVDVTSSSTRNVPILIPGTNPGSSYIWPWQQGTALMTDGYQEDSIAQYDTGWSAILGPWVDGDYDYYQLLEQSFSSNPFTTTEKLFIKVQCTLISDTANAIVQVVPYGVFSTGKFLQTQYMTMTKITDIIPYSSTFTLAWQTDVTSTNSAYGFAIRNITAGSDVTVVTCSWSMQQMAF
jgi:hypothetical protein